jgi:hypothetical protein
MARVLLMHRVIMRTFLALTLFAAACTTAAPAGNPNYDSVRDRLSEGPTHLFVGGADSTGSVTARRWTPGGWIEGDSTLVIESGELFVAVDASGRLSLSKLEVRLAPIEIPEEVFKKPAQLSDVRIKLTDTVAGTAQWASDDEASASLPLMLDLEWAIAISGGKTPLGTQRLPPVDVDLTLAGDGTTVEARIGLAATGMLWNWAGLLELTHLELQLQARTLD